MGLLKRLFSGKNPPNEIIKRYSKGDIFYTKYDDRYHVYKLLLFESDFDCYHVLAYQPLDKKPETNDIDTLEIYAYHMPVDVNGFDGSVLLGKREVVSDDLLGYHEYLRQTAATADIANKANEHYLLGYNLTDENKHEEAISEYSKAIELVPTFFEAIDNRAFCKMDLGRWSEAIEDFRTSLIVKPDSVLAEFSIGECYLRLKDYQKAKEQFEIAHKLSPDESYIIEFLKKADELLRTT